MPPLIWNPTEETVHTKMQGSWFKFTPDMKKSMDEDKARFISEHRKETGLVVLPEAFDPLSESYKEGYEKTEEGKKLLAENKLRGIENLLAFHRDIIRNNQVSLRRDVAKSNPQGDSNRMVALEMSDGEFKSLQLVNKYQKNKQDSADQKIKVIQNMLDDVGPIGKD